jgi:predicted phage baseplate assembly protein
VRRLLRLIDYTPYPGHAASTWLVVDASAAAGAFLLPAGFAVATKAPATVFETTQDCVIYPAASGYRLFAPAPSPTNPREAVLASIDTAMLAAGTRLLFASGRLREWAEVESATAGAGTTTLLLRQPLAHRYPVSPEPTVRGNAVHATHGERRRREERGSGLPNQGFELEFAPLTYTKSGSGEPRSTLEVVVAGERWTEVADFVGSAPSDTHFSAARDNAGYVTVRFGDGQAGRMPRLDERIDISWRVGIGEAGRVAADSLTQFTDRDGRIRAIGNPFAASDPGEPQSLAQARLLGPRSLEVRERAVVEADYEALAAAGVQLDGARLAPIQAKARLRWTGSWTTVFVSLDLPGRVPLAQSPGLREAFESLLAEKKLAGYDVRVEDARYASLHIGLQVDVAPGFFARDVRTAVEAVLVGAPGRRAPPFFGPGRFRFGEPVYLSDLYAAVAAVPGVLAVSVTRFKRFGARHPDREAQGFIPVGKLEVARCDNDASHPENGLAYVRTCGGREG